MIELEILTHCVAAGEKLNSGEVISLPPLLANKLLDRGLAKAPSTTDIPETKNRKIVKRNKASKNDC